MMLRAPLMLGAIDYAADIAAAAYVMPYDAILCRHAAILY